MKRIVTGILAHVDSGKTTLSEGLLYSAGEIRKKGRVDHKDTFLDTNEMERERGITIFAKQAVLKINDSIITLLDTPGHVDFSAETERTLGVLDYAVLVISGTDGVQSHTETLWHLLKNHNIPVFIFVNKMDISSYDKNTLLHNLKAKISENCIDFGNGFDAEFYENAAMCDEEAMQSFLDSGKVENNLICLMIKQRKLFPVFFGSALKQEGVDEFLKLFAEFTTPDEERENFSAKVFKITQDEQGNRLTHMKITGGKLKVKEVISGTDKAKNEWNEKVNAIRIYSGNKFTMSETAEQGCVCAVTGLTSTYPGEGLGAEESVSEYALEPVFLYKVRINDGTDNAVALAKLKKLEEEEPQLNVFWNEYLKEIHLRLMGEIQCEILKRVILERFDMDIDFDKGGIVYKETIKNTVEGVGHYEPLRHYAEVHLLMEAGEKGSGVVFESACSEDELAKNWQRLILSHLSEKEHIGVLTGSPITDIKITLAGGKAHLKHTEGGDFRQATYRAVRHGLMKAQNVLLEPWYSFTLEVPTTSLGRAMTDIERMGGQISYPENMGERSVIKGKAPVEKMRDYRQELIVYTKGRGQLSYNLCGYEPCTEQDRIVSQIGYDPESDIENTADSVFCSHGAGFLVKWDEVEEYMHLDSCMAEKKKEQIKEFRIEKKVPATDEELMRIFERTYGKVNIKPQHVLKTSKRPTPPKTHVKVKKYDKTYLLVDGYNIIFADSELKTLSKDNLDLARNTLINRLCSYKSVRECEIIIVFDAYKVKGNHREIEKINDISIVYTKEAETADAYIEKTSQELSKNNRVQVATSDALEQIIIMGSGALRVSASQLLADLKNAEKEIENLIKEVKSKNE